MLNHSQLQLTTTEVLILLTVSPFNKDSDASAKSTTSPDMYAKKTDMGGYVLSASNLNSYFLSIFAKA